MAALRVSDLAEILPHLPPDAVIVVPDYDWDTDQDQVWSVDKGISLDEDKNEVVLYKGDILRKGENV